MRATVFHRGKHLTASEIQDSRAQCPICLSKRPRTAARVRTVAMPTTIKANSPFSNPLMVQMTKDGTAAVIAPAPSVIATACVGITSVAIVWKQRNIPKQHIVPTSFGKTTKSVTPNKAP